MKDKNSEREKRYENLYINENKGFSVSPRIIMKTFRGKSFPIKRPPTKNNYQLYNNFLPYKYNYMNKKERTNNKIYRSREDSFNNLGSNNISRDNEYESLLFTRKKNLWDEDKKILSLSNNNNINISNNDIKCSYNKNFFVKTEANNFRKDNSKKHFLRKNIEIKLDNLNINNFLHEKIKNTFRPSSKQIRTKIISNQTQRKKSSFQKTKNFSSYLLSSSKYSNNYNNNNNNCNKIRLTNFHSTNNTQKNSIFQERSKDNFRKNNLLKTILPKSLNLNKVINKYKSRLICYSKKSKGGTDILGNDKINQDNYLCLNKIYGLKNYSVFGVFDGHGENGHLVSDFVKKYLTSYFLFKNQLDEDEKIFINNKNLSNTPQEDFFSSLSEKTFFDKLTNQELIKDAFSNMEEILLKKETYNTQYSGTTCILVIHIEDKLICYNVGDSRAIYINENFSPVQISKDHKPDFFSERLRIESKGGRVEQMNNGKGGKLSIGPYRVWLRDEPYPGLSMSRSIGDFVAGSIGVISEPEIFEVDLVENKVKAVIIGSDGLWEFLSNEKVCEIAKEFLENDDSNGCVNELFFRAKMAWKNNGKKLCDDITIIVLIFKSTKDNDKDDRKEEK